jgi:hypothetical protein
LSTKRSISNLRLFDTLLPNVDATMTWTFEGRTLTVGFSLDAAVYSIVYSIGSSYSIKNVNVQAENVRVNSADTFRLANALSAGWTHLDLNAWIGSRYLQQFSLNWTPSESRDVLDVEFSNAMVLGYKAKVAAQIFVDRDGVANLLGYAMPSDTAKVTLGNSSTVELFAEVAGSWKATYNSDRWTSFVKFSTLFKGGAVAFQSFPSYEPWLVCTSTGDKAAGRSVHQTYMTIASSYGLGDVVFAPGQATYHCSPEGGSQFAVFNANAPSIAVEAFGISRIADVSIQYDTAWRELVFEYHDGIVRVKINVLPLLEYWKIQSVEFWMDTASGVDLTDPSQFAWSGIIVAKLVN